MKRYALSLVVLLLAAIAPAQDFSHFKKAYFVDTTGNLSLADDVREKLTKWDRWQLVSHPEDADVLIVLSETQQYAGTVAVANANAAAYGNRASASGFGVAAPLYDKRWFLILTEKPGDNPLLVVSSPPHLFRSAAGPLVEKMKGQLEKHEKRNSR